MLSFVAAFMTPCKSVTSRYSSRLTADAFALDPRALISALNSMVTDDKALEWRGSAAILLTSYPEHRGKSQYVCLPRVMDNHAVFCNCVLRSSWKPTEVRRGF